MSTGSCRDASAASTKINQRTNANMGLARRYAHFEDKYALLECWMRTKFHRAVQSQLPAAPALEINTLRALVVGVFDFLATFRGYMKPPNKQFEPLFEVALQQELQEVLLNWLNQIPPQNSPLQRTSQTTATIISWTIFGPAVQWSRGAQTCAAAELAEHVLTIVVAGLSPMIAVT